MLQTYTTSIVLTKNVALFQQKIVTFSYILVKRSKNLAKQEPGMESTLTSVLRGAEGTRASQRRTMTRREVTMMLLRVHEAVAQGTQEI
jgi:hypothetical protein